MEPMSGAESTLRGPSPCNIATGSPLVRPARHPPGLPRFTLGGYMRDLTATSRIESQRLEAERLDEEKKRKEYREERERKTAMFTMPGYPPLAMAPDFDPEYLENLLPSDKQYGRLFPNNPELICKAKDLIGEREALIQYLDWLLDMKHKENVPAIRKQFYHGLRDEVWLEFCEFRGEYHSLLETATPLGLFELRELDRDLRTTQLEEKLRNGDIYIENEHDSCVQAAYGHLFSKYPYMERFEQQFELDKGTGKLEDQIWRDIGFLDHHGDDVKRKYGHLRPAALEKSLRHGNIEVDYRLDSSTKAEFKDLFLKYPYLERFEKHFDLDRGTEKLERKISKDIGFVNCHGDDVKRKYGHLRQVVLEKMLGNGDIEIDYRLDSSTKAEFQHLFLKHPYLERFEKHFELDKGTGELEDNIKCDIDFLDGHGDDVKRKYGYLRQVVLEKMLRDGDTGIDIDDRLDSSTKAEFEHLFLKYPYLERFEGRLRNGDIYIEISDRLDPFTKAECENLLLKYPYLERFEKYWEVDKGTRYLELCLGMGGNVVVVDGHDEVEEKYGYLRDVVEKRKQRREEALQTKTVGERKAIPEKRLGRYNHFWNHKNEGPDEHYDAFLTLLERISLEEWHEEQYNAFFEFWEQVSVRDEGN